MKTVTLNSMLLSFCGAICFICLNGSLIAQPVTPVNDLCADATSLPVNPPGQCTTYVTGDNTTAGYEGGFFSCVPDPDLFYTFNSGEYEAIQIIANPGTATYVALGVYPDCGADSLIYCAIATVPLNTHIIQVEPNTSYVMRLSTVFELGSFSLCLSGIECAELSLNIGDPCDDGNPNTTNDQVQENCECAGIVPPENDLCSDAIPLIVNGEDVLATNIDAVADGPVIECAYDGDAVQHDVWFSFVAPPSGILTIETSGIASGEFSDTEMQLLNGCGQDAVKVSCNDDDGIGLSALITLPCGSYIPGATYYIQVDGYSGQTGAFNISVKSQSCESTFTACYDGIDNDNDGAIDCEDTECQSFVDNLGCTACLADGTSFADAVIEYNNTCPNNTETNESFALGVPNYSEILSNTYVSLGEGGYLKLLFINNILTNSGNSEPDLFVFEAGPAMESVSVELRPMNTATENQLSMAGIPDVDNDGFFEFGVISNPSSTLDIDNLIPANPANSLEFDAVKIMDIPDLDCVSGSAGADIDGVCALSNLMACTLSATEITVDGGMVQGDNSGTVADGPEMSCAWGVDILQHVTWFSFVAPATGALTIETSATSPQGLTDTQIQVLDACGDDAAVLACNEDAGDNLFSLITLDCGSYTPGALYYIQVDGFGYQVGTFNISVTSKSCESTISACADGIDNDGDGVIDCGDSGCQNFSNNVGCTTCLGDGTSFADEVIEYNNTCSGNTFLNESYALDMPNYSSGGTDSYVSLGEGGNIKLLFTNNTLTNSGNTDPDLHVFEVGPAVEAITIELRPANANTENQLIADGITDADGDGFYEIGSLSGASSALDIDAYISSSAPNSFQFDAVKIVDVPDLECTSGSTGADIDAVCALSNIADCNLAAIEIIVDGGMVEGDNTDALPAGPEMPCAFEDDPIQHVVWFSFVAPSSGILTIETSASNPIGLGDSQIQVLDACGNDATILACDDDDGYGLFSSITLACGSYTPGALYYIQVDGYIGFTGTFNISITSQSCETTTLACSDGIDNDDDGFIDCADSGCQDFSNNVGCTTCFGDGTSFADEVIEYNNTCLGNTNTNETYALGMPNYSGSSSPSYVSLGQGGSIKLAFTNNELTNSGNSDPDLHIFEVGPAVEDMTVELRPMNVATENQLSDAGIPDADGDGFYEFGLVDVFSSTVDIDAFFTSLPANSLQFDAVKIVDVDDAECVNGSTGADIDGVCALSNPDQVAALNGHVNWNSNCGSRNTTIKLYEPGTTILLAEYEVSIDAAGNFALDSIQTGTYDIFIKVEGYLQKGIPNVEIGSGANSLTVGGITNGDINNDNAISIADVSLINASFGSALGNPNYNPLADLNCDGVISLIDLSILNVAFGQSGDSPPSIGE